MRWRALTQECPQDWAAGTTRAQSARVAFLCFVLAGALGACSNDPQALYADPSSALPLVPFLPDDERIEECKACAREKCSAERAACVADRACAGLLDCRGDCDDPACLAGCSEWAHWDPDRVGFPQNEIFDAFERCVALRACGGECGWGKNWGCGGEYSWPAPEDPSHLPYELEVHSANDGAGHVAKVLACPLIVCTGPIDEAESDGWGQVELDVGAISKLEFLRLDFGETTVDLYGAPVFRRTRAVFRAPTRLVPELVSLVLPNALEFADPASTILGLQALDCTGTPASGVSFELVGVPDARSFYISGAFGAPSITATQTDDSGRGGFIGLAEGTLGVRVLGPGDEPLASRDVQVTAGQVTAVLLFPGLTENE
jgi:hypothetical protein